MITNTLSFNVGLKNIPPEISNGTRKPIKREFLRIIMSAFDPLGLLYPLTLKSKIVMQEIWRRGIDWDKELRDEGNAGWLSWVRSLHALSEYKIPRCLSPMKEPSENIQLHVFCDASIKAYAAVEYVRFEIPNSTAHVAIVMGKSLVSSLKPLSIPH